MGSNPTTPTIRSQTFRGYFALIPVTRRSYDSARSIHFERRMACRRVDPNEVSLDQYS